MVDRDGAAPDTVYAIGVSHKEVLRALSVIERDSFRFGPPRWLSWSGLDGHIPTLLPRGQRELTSERLAEIETYFAPHGRFPALRISSE